MKTDNASKFNSLIIVLHWSMLLLLAAVYACMELREIFPKGSDPREAMKTWHYMLGLSVFVLVWIRLIARLIYATPPIQPLPGIWQQRFALVMHGALYAIMVALPLIGWLLLSAEGKPIPFFGLQLPALIAADKGLADSIKELHEALATIGYVLVGLHAAAALIHHYWLRDNTLRRMLPLLR